MKYKILLLALFLLPFHAYAQKGAVESLLKFSSKDRLFVGPGVGYYQSPYIGDKDYVDVVPLVYYQAPYLVINGPEIYVPLFKYFGLRGQYRTDGTGSKDINGVEYEDASGDSSEDGKPEIENILVRKDSLDAGVYFGFLGLSVSFITDVTDTHKGSSVVVDLGTIFEAGDFEINPRLSYRAQDKKLTNYYYGVSEEEAEKSVIPYYNPDKASSVLNYGLTVLYYVSKNWSLNLIYDGYAFSKEIKDSPIVTRSPQSLVAGVTYHFF